MLSTNTCQHSLSMTEQQKSNLPLTRKYRPCTLDQLRAQEQFATVITNAIESNKLAHAYLLSGIRGVGKTSMARAIARTINCTQPKKSSSGILTSCGACKSCCACALQNHPDIIELDAASNTGVDDIRAITDGVEYKPLISKYKVYIIDEVHMLSRGAFNAFLKTLEEPPQHLVFILATTEIHKVPATVLSRCQRFDLKRFSLKQLSDLLEEICSQERIKASPTALSLIASRSEGSARDAISMLDQLRMAVGLNSSISAEAVQENLGLISERDVIELLSRIFEGKAEEALKQLSSIYESSSNFASLFDSMLEVLSICCKLKLAPSYKLQSFVDYKDAIDKITNSNSLAKLTMSWQLAFNATCQLSNSQNHLQYAEILAAKLICTLSFDKPGGINWLLDYLFSRSWFDLFYYLVNEVEIIEFNREAGILTLSAEGSKPNLHTKIQDALKGELHLQISSINLNRSPVSLKTKLIEKLKKTDKWETLKSCFQVTDVCDILFLGPQK